MARRFVCLDADRIVFRSRDYGAAWAYWRGRQQAGHPVTLAKMKILGSRKGGSAVGVTKSVTKTPAETAGAE